MDQLEAHQRAIAAAQQVIDGVTAEQLTLPTPCTDWDVHALLAHMIGGNWWVARFGGVEMPAGDPVTADPATAFRLSATAAQAQFAQPDGLSRVYELPFGMMPGNAFIGLRTTDLLVHAWDLAKATTQSTDLDEELAAEALEAAKMRIQPMMRGEGRPFQAEQTAADGAPAIDQLAAFLGREV